MDDICTNCKGVDVIEDKGESVCRACGCVLQERCAVLERTFDHKNFKKVTHHKNGVKSRAWLYKKENPFLTKLKKKTEKVLSAMFNGDTEALVNNAYSFCKEAYEIELAQKQGKIAMEEKMKKIERNIEKEVEKEEENTLKRITRASAKASKIETGVEKDQEINNDVEIIAIIEANTTGTNEEGELTSDSKKEKNEDIKRIRHSSKSIIVAYSIIKALGSVHKIVDINDFLKHKVQLARILKYGKMIEESLHETQKQNIIFV